MESGNIAQTGDESTRIPRISCDELPVHQFHDEFMSKNLPVIVTGLKIKTDISESWFEEGKLKLEKLLPVLNDHSVPVADCTKSYFDSHEKLEMKFSDYVDYWNGDRKKGKFYLKDFHLKHEFPELNFYTLPVYFENDWLNKFLIDNKKDDFRFIYIGPAGTWTSLHSDVYGSYSWSSNIYGRKHWLLLQPSEEQKLKDNFGHLPFSISREELIAKKVKHFDFVQECNETLFVPSGWYHQVTNLEDTVSINHNWFNGCNIRLVAEKIMQRYDEISEEISDCKDADDFPESCQLMLKSLFGMDFQDFVELVSHIMNKRIDSLTSQNQESLANISHAAARDLTTILELFEDLGGNTAISQYPNILQAVTEGINKIKRALS